MTDSDVLCPLISFLLLFVFFTVEVHTVHAVHMCVSVCRMFSPASCAILIFLLLLSFYHPVSPSPPNLPACLSSFLTVSLFLSLTPPSMTLLPHHHQAKVRELEEKCRSQSEQFNLLSKELEKFRLQAGKFDILSTEPLTLCESPGSPQQIFVSAPQWTGCPPRKRYVRDPFIPVCMTGHIIVGKLKCF